MSEAKTNFITWERFEAHGFPYFRSRGTHSAWELHCDGDGWCLSQDGALLEWHGVLDEVMAWVGEVEHWLGGTGHSDGLDRAEAWEIPLLENNHADLEIWNGDDFELRFLDAPRIGATFVVGHYPGSWPWFSCFSTPTVEDVVTVNSLIKGGYWQVTHMSDRWERYITHFVEADVETDSARVGRLATDASCR